MKSCCVLLLFLSGSGCFSQTVIDYYLSSQGKNRSVFGFIGMKDLKKKVYYKVKDAREVYYKVKSATVTVTTVWYKGNKMLDRTKQLVVIDSSHVSVVRSTANNSNPVEIFKPNENILLKMPPENGTAEWTDVDHSGSVTSSYVSEFSKIKIDGKEMESIKVTIRTIDKHSKKELMCKIDYYVLGIGHYKMTTQTGIPIETLEIQTEETKPLD